MRRIRIMRGAIMTHFVKVNGYHVEYLLLKRDCEYYNEYTAFRYY